MPAVSGHTALIAMEKDGDAGGTFTDVARVTSDIPFNLSRSSAASTPHGDTVETSFVGPMQREPMTISGDFIYDNATHDDTTGLQKRYIDGDKFGILIKGPNWASGVDEIIASGYLTNFNRNQPQGAGPVTFEATMVFDGAFKIDGVSIGTVAA